MKVVCILVDRGVFEVNELYEYGLLVSVVLGNFILIFSNILYVYTYIFYLSISFCSFLDASISALLTLK